MVLMVVGRYKDKRYCVLNLETLRVNALPPEELKEYIKMKVVGNAFLMLGQVKGLYHSFSRLRYVEDTITRPNRLILYKDYQQGKLGYWTCYQDGTHVEWLKQSIVDAHIKDFANVSVYLSRGEKQPISSTGFEFPYYSEILNEKAVNRAKARKEKGHKVTQQEVPDETYSLESDIAAIRMERQKKIAQMQGIQQAGCTDDVKAFMSAYAKKGG